MSTGTRPEPPNAVTRVLKSGASSEITVSSNAMSATFIAIHGRHDQDEEFLLPMTRCSDMVLRAGLRGGATFHQTQQRCKSIKSDQTKEAIRPNR